MAKKYTTKKYNGDDRYSWAIFYTREVKGMRSPVFMGDAEPVMSGMDVHEARDRCKRLNQQSEQDK